MNIRVGNTLFILISLFILPSCYLSDQASGQFDLIWNQSSLDIAIEKETNPKYKKLLKLIPQIKQFGEKSLKLTETENYNGYFATKNEGITFVVTASDKYRLKEYTWWFPLVGTIPYKGYFKKADAVKLDKELREEGFDTWLFAAPAYSTLGWFKDPVTTPMLRRGMFSLVDTILHEMTHATIYVKNQGDFNEQLATFVGTVGAEEFFHANKILSEQQLKKISQQRAKSEQFNFTVNSFIPKFSALYQQKLKPQEMAEKKRTLFNELFVALSKIYPSLSKKNWKFNNARLLQFKRYQQKSKLFVNYWEQSGHSWTVFWELIRQHIKKQGW